MRVRSDFEVAALVRRCHAMGGFAVVRRKGAAEAGAIHVVVDDLAGGCRLLSPAPQTMTEGGERRWQPVPDDRPQQRDAIEKRLQRELSFDPDLWIVEIEDRQGRSFLPSCSPVT
jgi:hypothetical protein